MPGMGAHGRARDRRIEKRITVADEVLPMRKPATSTKSTVREQGSEAASA